MPFVDSSNLFQKVRERMVWEHEKMLGEMHLDESTARRKKQRQNSPSPQTKQKILDASPNIDKLLLFPYQKQQDDQSKRALLAFEKNEPTPVICKLIHNALALTDTSEKGYIGKPLIAFEPELFHTLARVYARDGKQSAAIQMLQNVLSSVEKFSPDSDAKEMQVVPMMLTLAKLQWQAKNYSGASITCDNGFGMAARRLQGRHCPSFIVIKAHIQFEAGDKSLCPGLLMQAYAGYIAINNADAAKSVQSIAYEKFGIQLKTHGLETLLPDAKPKTNETVKAVATFKKLGDVLKYFCAKSGANAKDIYAGLCDAPTFSRLLNDVIKTPNAAMAEALMQRMGRDIGLYCNLLVPIQEFDRLQLRDAILLHKRARKYHQASMLLKNFEAIEARRFNKKAPATTQTRNKNRIWLQFIKATEATVYGETCARDDAYLSMLQEAINLTIPNFDEKKVSDYRYTVREAVLVQQMAMHYESDEPLRAMRIYHDLLYSIESHWVDETLKSRMYATVSFNYASHLGRQGQRKEALAIIDRALEYGIGCSDLVGLPGLFYNKAYGLFELGRKEESFPLFMLAYYLYQIFENHGRAEHVKVAQTTIKSNFGIEI